MRLLKWFFPLPCLRCGRLSDALCDDCYERLPFEPHWRDLEKLSVACALKYEKEGDVSELVHCFKYKHQSDVQRLLVPLMADALSLLQVDFSELVLVPVPLHRKRELERGYNQARLLAKGVSKRLGCGFWDGLVRVKETASQVELGSRAARMQNLLGAFELGSAQPSGQLVLVDDIVTTGSTLLSCAEVLRAAGAESILALTLANRE